MKDTLRPIISKKNEDEFIAKASTAIDSLEKKTEVLAIHLTLEDEIIHKLRLLALNKKMTLKALVAEAVKDLLIKYNGK